MTQTEWEDEIAEAWYSIKNFPKDLKTNHLHLCSYHELRDVLNDILDGKEAVTLNSEVAEWCMNHNLSVKVDTKFVPFEFQMLDPTMLAWRITRKETVQ